MRLSLPVGRIIVRPPTAALALCAACSVLVSCAPRYSLHEVSAPGFGVEGEAFVATAGGLGFAYDFWGAEGVPFVAILNETADTLWLDLHASMARSAVGTFNLGEVLAGGPADARAIALNYPGLAVERRPLSLVLAPGRWTEFYGLPQVEGPSYGGNARRHEASYRYVVTDADGTPATVTHMFSDYVAERLKRKEFLRRSANAPPPNRYFLDRGPQRQQAAMEAAMGLSNVIWLL